MTNPDQTLTVTMLLALAAGVALPLAAQAEFCLQPGDQVNFRAIDDAGEFTITEMLPAK